MAVCKWFCFSVKALCGLQNSLACRRGFVIRSVMIPGSGHSVLQSFPGLSPGSRSIRQNPKISSSKGGTTEICCTAFIGFIAPERIAALGDSFCVIATGKSARGAGNRPPCRNAGNTRFSPVLGIRNGLPPGNQLFFFPRQTPSSLNSYQTPPMVRDSTHM